MNPQPITHCDHEIASIRAAFRVACTARMESLLTDAQLRFVRLMAGGLRMKDAANRLGITYSTAQTVVKNINRRLETKTITQAIAKVAGYDVEENEQTISKRLHLRIEPSTNFGKNNQRV